MAQPLLSKDRFGHQAESSSKHQGLVLCSVQPSHLLFTKLLIIGSLFLNFYFKIVLEFTLESGERKSEVSVSSKAASAAPAQLYLKAASLSPGRLLKSCHTVMSNIQLMCLGLGWQPFIPGFISPSEQEEPLQKLQLVVTRTEGDATSVKEE